MTMEEIEYNICLEFFRSNHPDYSICPSCKSTREKGKEISSDVDKQIYICKEMLCPFWNIPLPYFFAESISQRYKIYIGLRFAEGYRTGHKNCPRWIKNIKKQTRWSYEKIFNKIEGEERK